MVIDETVEHDDVTYGERAVWDCYAEDYTDSEAFVWRWVRALNAVEKSRGWLGFFWDFLGFFVRRSKSKND